MVGRSALTNVKSTLKVVSILFLLSCGLSAVITAFGSKSYVEPNGSDSPFVNATE